MVIVGMCFERGYLYVWTRRQVLPFRFLMRITLGVLGME